MGYGERSSIARNRAAGRLFRLMEEKRTNLALSADVKDTPGLLRLTKAAGSEICMLKTHCDAIPGFAKVSGELKDIARELGLMIFEDRKLGDIGSVVRSQNETLAGGWADFVSAHAIAGEDSIRAIDGNVIMIAEMTSRGSLAKGAYTEKAIAMGRRLRGKVAGFVVSGRRKTKIWEGFVVFTPGIHVTKAGDALGQRYILPEEAIRNGSDIIIAGRGIYHAGNPQRAAVLYRKRGWEAYMKRRGQ